MFDIVLKRLADIAAHKPFVCTEEQAIGRIAEELGCRPELVLEKFTPDVKLRRREAEANEVSDALWAVMIQEERLSNLRIEFGRRSSERLAERKAHLKALKRVLKHSIKLVGAVSDLSARPQDNRLLSSMTNSRQDWHDLLTALQSEIDICEKSLGPLPASRPRSQAAYFLAERLAVLFVDTGRKVTVGKHAVKSNQPTGDYCKTLVLLFDLFGVQSTFENPANHGKKFVNQETHQIK